MSFQFTVMVNMSCKNLDYTKQATYVKKYCKVALST